MTDQSVPILEHAAGRTSKRDLIMRAAEQLFYHRRFHEVTLDEVAEAAHVGKGTIYRYFEDKDDLFFQIATAGFDELCDRVEACAKAELPLRTRLLRMVGVVCAYFDERKVMFAIIHADSSWMREGPGGMSERWRERRRRLPTLVAGVFAEAMSLGELRATVPPTVLSYHFLGMIRTIVRDLSPDFPNEAHMEQLVSIFLDGAALGSGE